eukprot:gene5847-biopygen5794
MQSHPSQGVSSRARVSMAGGGGPGLGAGGGARCRVAETHSLQLRPASESRQSVARPPAAGGRAPAALPQRGRAAYAGGCIPMAGFAGLPDRGHSPASERQMGGCLPPLIFEGFTCSMMTNSKKYCICDSNAKGKSPVYPYDRGLMDTLRCHRCKPAACGLAGGGCFFLLLAGVRFQLVAVFHSARPPGAQSPAAQMDDWNGTGRAQHTIQWQGGINPSTSLLCRYIPPCKCPASAMGQASTTPAKR